MAAQNLAGLGLGLTPAGDDFLLGAIYAARIIHPREKAQSITGTIASAAIPRTSSLSATWMHAAARGLVGEAWFDFFDELKIPGLPSIESSLHRLLSIGHTSGADALAGFIGCLTQGMNRADAEINYLQSKMNTSLRLQALQSLCGIEAA
jgi:hypothetical protein